MTVAQYDVGDGSEPSASLTDEQIRTLTLEEIARACPTASARWAAVFRLQAIAGAAKNYALDGNGLIGAVVHELEFRALRFMREYVDGFWHAVEALCAFGEAIAIVAQFRVIARVMDGGWVSYDTKWLTLSLVVQRANPATAMLVRYESGKDGELVAEWTGHPVDFAAEAIARMIEEAERAPSLSESRK
jgi:hypothetical protein